MTPRNPVPQRDAKRPSPRSAATSEFIEGLSELATDDLLPRWSSWFGEDVMRDLVPDAAQRARVVHDLPRVPLSLLRTEVPVPDGWDRRPCAYLLLSA